MASEQIFPKGLGGLGTVEEIEAVGARGWNVLREDLSLPVAVLVKPRVEHNLRWMTEFVQKYGVFLAPHGKTTMAAKLFGRQMDEGAWGITLATAQQCAVAHAHGVRRILMANELIGRANFELVSDIIAGGTTFYTLVDSPDLVCQLGSFFQGRGQKLRVLVELGVNGGRTGTRTDEQTQAVVDAIAQWSGSLLLCGVEVYEGVLKDEAGIREYLGRAVDTVKQLQKQGAFAQDERVILSGAGSAWYDVVADVFAAVRDEVDVVLRPGCYLTSDAGIYRVAQQEIGQRNSIARAVDTDRGSTLQSALEVWAYVQSVPEPGLAIVGMGKRDVAFDSGLPVAVWHFRPGVHREPARASSAWETVKLMDQHAYLQVPQDADIKVGDMLGFEISHPCLTFDKWRYVAMVDESYNVLEAIPTYF
ncbi:amino acid deaminase [Terriglobus sp. TAA 43]|uniref:amino acid deaminase n=1 Tax=Terriglobus sp. TAA 43 TaxID=278961 RepID=UPI000645D533|nr:amino acid deaminase [Terriglobus sp. TAA 43]